MQTENDAFEKELFANEDYDSMTDHSNQLAKSFSMMAKMKVAMNSVIRQSSMSD